MIVINWNDLIMVGGVAIGASAIIATLFAIGVRFLTNAQQSLNSGKRGKESQNRSLTKEIAYGFAAVLCFLAASSVLAYGLYVIVTFSRATPPA